MVNLKKDQNTEGRILAAAKQVFVEKGIEGARMQDIADKAGINKALLHYYFRNKEKLFEVIFIEAAATIIPRVTEIMLEDKPLFEKIEKFVDAYITLIMDNPHLPIFVMNEINRQPQQFSQKIFGNKRPPLEKVVEQVDKEVKAGIIKPIHGLHLMLNMVSMCIFPFIGRPMFQWVAKLSDSQFRQMMEQRKKLVAQFIIDSIRK